jgi:hypothetical protein
VTILLLVLLNSYVSPSVGASTLPDVTVVGDHISVQAKGVQLGDILMAIEQKTGIRFEANERILEKKIYVEIEELHLLEAIKKILPSMNHAIVYNALGKIHKVVIIEREETPEMKATSRAIQDITTQFVASSTEGVTGLEPYSGSDITVIKAPPGVDPKSLKPPPGSDITVIKGPPGVDPKSLKPPPGSHIDVIHGPPGLDPKSLEPPPGSEMTVIKGPPGVDPRSLEPPPGSEMTGMRGPPGMNAPDFRAPPTPPVFPRTDE